MQTLELDGRDWRSEADFYNALATALGCFDGHGRNAEAFLETMVYYLELNAIRPPYDVIIRDADASIRPFLADFASWLQEARAERAGDPDWGDDVDVRVIVT